MPTTSMRTSTCGDLRAADEGKRVRLCGWAAKVRDHGGVVFLDLRDRWGVTQAVFRPEAGEASRAAAGVRAESVLAVEGVVRRRPEGLANPRMKTGEIEVEGASIEVLSEAAPTPFVVAGEEEPSAELRMKYRYLDLRRPGQIDLLTLRARVASLCRRTLEEREFVEVETPFLVKSTPEGARDYLVPSRVAKGSFYALPQSPQLFKQMLMVAGLDRYYQIVRCFRDEDLRSDRQPEFTQLDIEMSFAGEAEIAEASEAVLAAAMREVCGETVALPLPRMPWDEAMARYGSDKPDLRFGLPVEDLAGALRDCGFGPFEAAFAAGGTVRGLRVPGGAGLSRKQVGELEDAGKAAGLKGLVSLKVGPEGVSGSAAGKMKPGSPDAAARALSAAPGDLLLLAAGEPMPVSAGLGAVRLKVGAALKLREKRFAAFWVVDPPLSLKNPETGRPEPSHHPFTSPRLEDLPRLETDPLSARARAYDLVLNGCEIAGGSVRIHRSDVQAKIFGLLGITPEKAQRKFGFFLEALRYGTPPHAGIAFGFDRFVMLLAGQDQIREVIAFPKTTSASCLLTGAPSTVDPEQLQELGIEIKAPPPPPRD
ncbi:MAG: aspartate--tRNA ligase [Planctomycetes bacterium]|nr:aspartate--tRNA ligase [Planctomycetota bacterium]